MGTIGVNVAIFRDGKILLTKRDDFHVWCMPGGHIDAGETFPQAAVREAHEETGLAVAPTRLIGIYSRPRWGEYHIMVFAAQILGGAERKQPGEVVEIDYFSRDEIPEALLLGQRQRILDAFDGGHGLCRHEEYCVPPDRSVDRQDMYALCTASGLPRHEFYRDYSRGLRIKEPSLKWTLAGSHKRSAVTKRGAGRLPTTDERQSP